MIAIIDYGAGNLRSVQKAFEHLGCDSRIVAAAADLEQAERVVLPGVGAFGAAIEQLQRSGLLAAVSQWLQEGRPFLGICLGMQLLFSGSEEAPGVPGLGFLPGYCRRLRSGKVPHMGWNQVRFTADTMLNNGNPEVPFFYFVHSYYAAVKDDEVIAAECQYGSNFTAAVRRGTCLGVQFHPEKSGAVGLRLLENWVTKC